MKNSTNRGLINRSFVLPLTLLSFVCLLITGCTNEELLDENIETTKLVSKAFGDCTSIALKGNNGRYVSSENGNRPMNCNRTKLDIWEKFTLIDLGGGQYALQGNNGRYVSSENGNKPISCNRTAIRLATTKSHLEAITENTSVLKMERVQ